MLNIWLLSDMWCARRSDSISRRLEEGSSISRRALSAPLVG